MADRLRDKEAILIKIEDWKRAFVNRDVDGLIKNYLPDAFLYDVKEDLRGVETIRELWEKSLQVFSIKPLSHHEDLEFHIGEDLAVVHGYFYLVPDVPDDHPAAKPMNSRITLCFERVKRDWRTFHEQVSF